MTARQRAAVSRHIANLGSDDIEVACRAMRLLARHHARRAQDDLAAATYDPDPEVRWRAGWAMAKSGLPVARAVLRRLLSDLVEFVRYEATCAFGELRCPDDVPWLLDLTRRPEMWRHDATPVILAINDIGPDATAALVAATRDPDARVRAMAAKCLGLNSTPEGEAALRTLRTDSDPEVRAEALDALAETCESSEMAHAASSDR